MNDPLPATAPSPKDEGERQTPEQPLSSGNGNTNGNNASKEQTGLLGWFKELLPARHENSLREAIEELIEDEADGGTDSPVTVQEKKLITNILGLRDLSVLDVMVPRADIVGIDMNATQDELFALLSTKPHSRIPVYEGELDNVTGIMHMKDVVANLSRGETFDMKKVMRDVLVVSPAMRVMDLMLQMRQSRVHIAMVVDEFGGIDGLITINDLVESIIGEVDDDYAFDAEQQILERLDGSVICDARVDIDVFENRFGKFMTEEEREEVDTLGGLVSYLAGHMPARGEIIAHGTGVQFEVLDADPRRINRLKVRGLPSRETPA